ncbi:MAG: CDP-diacylglycerol--serine O-phosphatidyltransferase [Bdellovibrionaceae bacterium]|nr:CDP-diacylglycerol--serine O-phosphatidyltransferase [Pseudobdellovibrionaceae bacterium]
MSEKKRPLKKLKAGTKKLQKKMHLNIYVLPNLLTTGNMFCGFYAVVHAIKGDFVMASYAIVAAAVFDLLDGRVARMTNSESEFGAQYDSLCDLISFGMAPAVLLFLWSLQDFGRLGWLASFFYVACGGLRLARFNVTQNEEEDKSYFQGLPIPMAAGIVASAVLAFNDLGLHAEKSRIILGITFLLGFVMVTSFRYRSFKDLDLKRRLPFHYLVLGVFVFAVVAIRPEVMLFVLFLTYAVLGAVFGILKIGKPNKNEALEEDVISEFDDNNNSGLVQ